MLKYKWKQSIQPKINFNVMRSRKTHCNKHMFFQVFEDKAAEREILDLQVKCNNFQRSCEWKGELRQLQVQDNFITNEIPKRKKNNCCPREYCSVLKSFRKIRFSSTKIGSKCNEAIIKVFLVDFKRPYFWG